MIVPSIMERLRQIVVGLGWDYCILWKLSQDQRCLELVDCCCAGVENGGEEHDLFLVPPVVPCRDVMFQHPRSKPCQLLAQLPSSMPLDGINAETLISNQPRWLNFSKISDETIGTRLLIPSPGGLVELFVAKQVSEDEHVIDFVVSQCNMPMEQLETVSFPVNMNVINMRDENEEFNHQSQLGGHGQTTPPFSPATALDNLHLSHDDATLDRIRICNSAMNFLQQFNYMSENGSNSKNNNNDYQLEETNMDAFPSSHGYEAGMGMGMGMDSLHKSSMNNAAAAADEHHPARVMEFSATQGDDKGVLMKHDHMGAAGHGAGDSDSDQLDDEDDPKYRRRSGKGPQSKNLEAERKRRKKLNERLYLLRSLVPKISKLDRASILGDAIEYVKELQQEVKDLQDELEQNSDDEGTESNLTNIQMDFSNHFGVKFVTDELESSSPAAFYTGGGGGGGGGGSSKTHADNLKRSHDSDCGNDKGEQMEVQVEVSQLEGNEFFIKVFGEQRRGGFVRLIEVLSSLGLEITNVSVTSCISLVSYVLVVEKRESEIVQVEYLRESLLEATRNNQWGGWSKIAKLFDDGDGVDHHPHHHHHHQYNSHQHHPHNHRNIGQAQHHQFHHFQN
ncbi:hypothetical protein Dimus_026177 [Dionaea muscipula]